MPKSKRAKLITLTKTDKKGREGKEALFDQIRTSLEKYRYVWVFDVSNMRNTFLKDVRQQWTGSRIMFGRTKVMAKALGLTKEQEYKDNLSKLTKYVNGNVGLLLTDESPETVQDWFDSYSQTDFARAGVIASQTITVPEGLVSSRGGQIPEDEDVPMAHPLESMLRSLGMPTRLVNGNITLDTDYTICTEGQTLDGRQTRLLKQFGVAFAQFKIKLIAYYDGESSKVTVVDQDKDSMKD